MIIAKPAEIFPKNLSSDEAVPTGSSTDESAGEDEEAVADLYGDFEDEATADTDGDKISEVLTDGDAISGGWLCCGRK